MSETKCNNCGKPHHSLPDVCFLSAFLGMLVHERECNLEWALGALATTNVDMFWDDIAPILDRLEEGHYEIDDSEEGE
jgi:hypothetical protein